MTADLWSEDAQGLWQSQESMVTRMSAEDMRIRRALAAPGRRSASRLTLSATGKPRCA